ncbi:MAG: four helix bundle protein [Bacteroidales bacterium]|nr:four helix bundle protein [Bacteroidales bacterium]
MFSFESLEVWQVSKKLVVSVYDTLKEFPSIERYALCDQIRRSIVSVPSNIAEGSGRTSVKEKIHFIEIAYGSLMECYCQLLIAVDLNYISISNVNKMKPEFEYVSKMLIGLRASFKKKLNTLPS